jgi:23S rRNA (cytosine1962-C5)-methyltransferase
MSETRLPKHLVLRKNEDRRILSGHPWVFSNEVRSIAGNPAIGDVMELVSAGGKSLGLGFYNPNSLIVLRLLSRQIEEINTAFFRRRIEEAFRLRQSFYPGSTTYRLVHGEGDFLPGLVVDRFNDMLVVQTLSYGMDARLPDICDALESILHPACIVERNESPLRVLDSLPEKKGVLRGTPAAVVIEEHGLRYTVHPLEGQKTGFFLDQRENRVSLRRLSRGMRVLDCFCNDGGFALNAAIGEASLVVGIDSSEEAVRRARANAALNGLGNVSFEKDDVFDRLKALREREARFDIIVLDPPSFTKSRKNVATAKRGYRDLHEAAFRILRKGGLLVSASCSHHIEPGVFLEIIDEAAGRVGRTLQLLDWRGAAPDHPSLPAVPETRYLKVGTFKAL